MTNWLKRAKEHLSQSPDTVTANTADRSLTAVSAVTEEYENTKSSIGSFDSKPLQEKDLILRLQATAHKPMVKAERDENVPAFQEGSAIVCHSKVLQESVLWVRNEKVKKELQSKEPEAVIYTFSELEALVEGKCSTEHLKHCHVIKKVFGAVITSIEKRSPANPEVPEKNHITGGKSSE